VEDSKGRKGWVAGKKKKEFLSIELHKMESVLEEKVEKEEEDE
jgi:hypothetical protein